MTQDNVHQEHQEKQVVESSTTEKQDIRQDQSIPLAKFLEVKDTVKELKNKLSSYEEKEKKLQESKLLEEKNYQELLAKRENELNSYKSQLEEERKNYKVATVKEKFARVLDKNNAINSDDVLKLVDVNSLMESEDQESAINQIVEEFKTSKSYLFKPAVLNHNENNKITNNTNKQANPNAKRDSALNIWMS